MPGFFVSILAAMTFSQDDLLPPDLAETTAAYDRFVPHQFLELLKQPSIVDTQLGDHVEMEMNLLFSDIRDFTSLSESILPAENFRFINSYLSVMEPLVTRHRGFIDKYMGDGIMALFPQSADDAVRAGIDMLRRLVSYNEGRGRAGYKPIRIGVGINTGLVMLGTVGGHNRMASTVIGDAVNFAARMEEMTKTYGSPLVISEHTLHALEDPAAYCIRFLDRLPMKGRYQYQSFYEVFDADPEPLWMAKQDSHDHYERAVACYHMREPERARQLLDECLRIAPDDRVARIYRHRCHDVDRGFLSPSLPPRDEILWRSDYSTLVSSFDHQHVANLALFARLFAQVDEGGPALRPLLDSIRTSLEESFGAEETFMEQHGYAFRDLHQRQHRLQLDALDVLAEDIVTGDHPAAYYRFGIQRQLVDCYINHTTKSDYHLGHFLNRHGVN